MNEGDSLILYEVPDGIPWIVGSWAARRTIAVTPAPPEWASAEFADAVAGGLCASIGGYCPRCEAIAALADVPDGEVVQTTRKVPHATWCAFSEETLVRLEEECRPPGVRWVADNSPETMARLSAYVEDLVVTLTSDDLGG